MNVIIIELTHRRNRNTENTNQTEGLSSSEANPPNQSSQNNSENVVEDIIPQSETTSLDNEQSSTIADEVSSQLDETELRHRRLNFFQGKNESSTISNPQTVVADSLNLNQEQGSPVLSPVTEPINRQQESVPLSAENETVHSRETDSETGLITVRLKYLNETQRNVTAAPNVTIGQFRRDHFATELSQNKLVRFIFNGQDLRNDSNTLQNYNIGNNSVVHCLITQVNQQAPPPRQENPGQL
uniref:Ubiquitin-like domain-containing protein n=1 Tax=Magallana gigas TaxID=29159 RepID=A0A8W8NHP0_MAGGI